MAAVARNRYSMEYGDAVDTVHARYRSKRTDFLCVYTHGWPCARCCVCTWLGLRVILCIRPERLLCDAVSLLLLPL